MRCGRLGLEWPAQSPVANLSQSELPGHRGRASRTADALLVGVCQGRSCAQCRRVRRVVVIDAGERIDDIVHDLEEVIVSMCARLYGKRAVKNPAKRAAMEAIECD